MSTAELRSFFGRIVDFGSAATGNELASFSTKVCCKWPGQNSSLWALMVAAAYPKAPELLEAEHAAIRNEVLFAFSFASDGWFLQNGILGFARGLLMSTGNERVISSERVANA